MSEREAWRAAIDKLAEDFEMAAHRMSKKTGDKTLDTHRDGQREAYFNCSRRVRDLLATQPSAGEGPADDSPSTTTQNELSAETRQQILEAFVRPTLIGGSAQPSPAAPDAE